MSKIHISDDLTLPLEAVTRTFAIMGIRGSGKTHTATVMVEEMLKAGQPVCIYDPVGAWFGLKTSADGKRPGFPVVIFGGEHQDVPLEETAGEMIAKVIVERRMPAILDCSLMRKGARIRFMADFCETLYHINREPLHFVADEAHTIAPLIVPKGEKDIPAARLLGAVEDMILLGRRRGLGATIVSQRPALVNTSVRTQCETLIAMRVVGPHDLKAIREWTDAHGTPEQAAEILSTLPMLKTGEGWFWSVWVDLFKRLMFRQRETFDSSATPKVGQKIIAPKVVAEIDLAALGEQIKATVEKAKADDPKALRAELAKARSDLQKALNAKPATETKTIEKPVVTDKQVKAVESIVARLEREGRDRIAAAEKLRESGELLIQKGGEFAAALRAASATPVRPAAPARAIQQIHRPLAAPPRVREPHGQPAEGGISKRQQRMLNAAATLATLGVDVTRETVSVWLGIHPRGGSVGEELSALVVAGMITYDRGAIVLTDAGHDHAEPMDPAKAIEQARGGLTPRQARIFDIITGVYPETITREQIAEQMGIHPRGGSFGEDIGRLAGRGLIDSNRGVVRARDFLFMANAR